MFFISHFRILLKMTLDVEDKCDRGKKICSDPLPCGPSRMPFMFTALYTQDYCVTQRQHIRDACVKGTIRNDEALQNMSPHDYSSTFELF